MSAKSAYFAIGRAFYVALFLMEKGSNKNRIQAPADLSCAILILILILGIILAC